MSFQLRMKCNRNVQFSHRFAQSMSDCHHRKRITVVMSRNNYQLVQNVTERKTEIMAKNGELKEAEIKCGRFSERIVDANIANVMAIVCKKKSNVFTTQLDIPQTSRLELKNVLHILCFFFSADWTIQSNTNLAVI